MEKYVVTGMNCAACSARVEKAVTKVEGVTSVSVNLLTGMMAVEGSAKSKDIIAAVTAAGYGARIDDDELNHEDNTEEKIKLRLIVSVIIVVPLMYLQMFAKFEYPKWIPAVMALAVMIINRRFFISGFKHFAAESPITLCQYFYC